MEKTEIQKFFSGQTIFVTGGTGFLGKLLIEKLLRACYDLKKIYILVRTKKGKTEDERFKEIFEAPCFEPLKELHPTFLEKVSLIYGDLLKPNIGFSEESKEILMKEVTTIFHVAATVRFDQHLRSATHINVRSVMDLLDMAKQMPQLKAFVHVSTAYSNSVRNDIGEKFYDPPMTAENLLRLLESLDDETITSITPNLLKNFPNSYVFTKCIAESVIAEKGKDLPIAMVRPAIVTVSVREPVSGWIDNIYGVNGVVAGAGLGIIRTMPAHPDVYAEIVPVDFVINNILAAAWNIENQREKLGNHSEITVYNYVSSTLSPISWGKFFEITFIHGMNYPLSKTIWYFCFDLRPHPTHHKIAVFFLHTIPAYIIDFVLLCLGKERIAVDGYKKVRKFLDVIAYFATRNWSFDSTNVKNLLSIMSPEDKSLFNFDLGKEDWNAIMENGIIGGRKYLVHDPLDTVPEARSKLWKLKIAHYTLCASLLFCLFLFARFIFRCFW